STELQPVGDPVKRVPISAREATSITDTGLGGLLKPSHTTTCFPLGLNEVSSPKFEIGIGLGAPARLGGERLITHTCLPKSVTKAWVWSSVIVQLPLMEPEGGRVTEPMTVSVSALKTIAFLLMPSSTITPRVWAVNEATDVRINASP